MKGRIALIADFVLNTRWGEAIHEAALGLSASVTVVLVAAAIWPHSGSW